MPRSLGRRRPAEGGTGTPEGRPDGFALLEVIIAFTVLVIVLVPTAALYSQIVNVSASSRDRVVAANLGSEQIQQAGATPFATLAAQVNTTQTSTVKEGGITYSVAQSSTWVNESNVANACGGTGNGSSLTEPMLAVTETVTWPYMGVTDPVVTETNIAAPPGYYSSSLGNLAVSVVDSNNQPVVGAPVTMTDTSTTPATPYVLDTGSTGCAFEAYIPAGSYTISTQLTGYVAMNEQSTATISPVALGSGDTVGETLNYAPAASVPISFAYTTPLVPPTTTTAAPTTTTLAPTTTTTSAGTTTTSSSTTTSSTSTTTTAPTTTTAATTTTTTPSPTAVYPTNGYPVTIFNNTPGTITYPAPVSATLALWPYSNGYDIYAGACVDNDPNWVAGSPATRVYPGVPTDQLNVTQGGTSPDTLQLYGLSITGTSAAGPVSNLQVTLTDTTQGCSSNNVYSFSAVSGNSTNIAMPLGTFSVTVSGTVPRVGGGTTPVHGSIASITENGGALAAQTVTLS